MKKTTVAVFFGAKSFEHDVSILTGLEACKALDAEKFNVIPVYIDLKNQMWIGEALFDKKTYPLNDYNKRLLSRAKILVGKERPTLLATERGFIFFKTKKIYFDAALLALHGSYGEDGSLQGLCEFAGIPYTGCRPLSAAICMNKSISKQLVKSAGVSVLDEIIIKRPGNNEFYNIEKVTEKVNLPFPLIVKPLSLGSSIGVSKANDRSELNASVLGVFALGDDAMVEPFVENLEEYNISVTRVFTGKTTPSVIEKPIKQEASFLGFVEKYLAGGTKGGVKKVGSKFDNVRNAGMINISREYNPKDLTKEESARLKEWAVKAFDVLNCNGVVRVDFMCNSKTREFYFGELNTIPGSMSYYLWEGSEPSYSYTDLLTAMIDEAAVLSKFKSGDVILSASNSKIFNER
jgi:D-alanine-D-alanine ligase